MGMESMPSNEPKKLEKPSGEWVQISGTENSSSQEDYGKWGANNGILAYVTEGGVKYIAPDTEERRQDLIMKGYEERGVGVPYSSGEKMPANQPGDVGWEWKKKFEGANFRI